MQIMLNCMDESFVEVTAATYLAPLCDYADLDGPLLIKNDLCRCLTYIAAKMSMPERVGIGVSKN